jgi:hypothetical protein
MIAIGYNEIPDNINYVLLKFKNKYIELGEWTDENKYIQKMLNYPGAELEYFKN